jgi:hypothetical protein
MLKKKLGDLYLYEFIILQLIFFLIVGVILHFLFPKKRGGAKKEN